MKKKHTVGFAVGEKFADLELCVFCKRLKDLSIPGTCEHYSEKYEDCSCSEFIRTDDVPTRLFEALEVRSPDK